MFVYNRADHFHATYEALAACPEAKDCDLFIFSDGWKSEEGKPKVLEVRNAVAEAAEERKFRSVTVRESPENRGLAASVIAGVSEVIQTYGSVIVVEDDCCTSPHFLRYMNRCLRFFESDPKIGAISGYCPVFPFPETYTADLFLTYRSCSWGWATWTDRWSKVDWTKAGYQKLLTTPSLIRKLNSCGNDRFLRLYRQTKGNGSSWSVRFGAHLVLQDQYTVYPRYSYVQNIGCDASGVHSRAEDAESMRVDLSKAIPDPKMEKLTLQPAIQKAMKKHYSAGVLSDMKRFAAAVAIVCKERIKRK